MKLCPARRKKRLIICLNKNGLNDQNGIWRAGPLFYYRRGKEKQMGGVVILLQDVTRLKHLEEEGQRRSRLLAMGEMAAHMAHEIRNPLGSIELFATLLKRELEHDPDKRDLAERISSGVRSLNHILTNLLLFTRSPKPAADPIAVNDLVSETLQFARYLLEQNHITIKPQFSC